MRPYTVYLSHQAHEFILSRRAKDRIRLTRFLQRLIEDPFQEGIEFVRDSTDRRNEVAFVGRFRVVFWGDHAVNEIKVVKIEASKPQAS